MKRLLPIVAFAACTCPLAAGTEPSFALSSSGGDAGGLGRIAVAVESDGQQVSALQFTARIPQEDLQFLRGTPSLQTLLPWSIHQSTATAEDGSLLVTALIEAPTGESLVLDGAVSELLLPIDLWAPAGQTVEVSLSDAPPDATSGRAMLAISTADGRSLVADTSGDGFLDADLDRPRAGAVELVISPPSTYEMPSFANHDSASPYKYFQLLPTVDATGTKLVGSAMAGLGFAVSYADASGLDAVPERTFLGIFLPPFTMAPYLERGYYPAYPGHLISSEWRIAGDGVAPADALGVEVSIGSSDSNFLARAIYQETTFPGSEPKGPPVVPFGDNSPRSLRVLAEVPGFAADGGAPGAPDGLFPMAAVLARPGMGTQGTATWMMSQITERVQPGGAPWIAFERFLCVDGGCGAANLAPPPMPTIPGSLPVQYAFTSAGAEIILPAGSPTTGTWSGYYSTTPAVDLHIEPAFVDSVACVEVEFLMPDARPDQLPNQIIAAFREGSFDYGAVAEFRPQSAPYEASGPGGLYTRRLWIDSQNIPNTGMPLTISIGISGDAARTGPQRVIIRRVTFTQYLRSSFI